MNLSLEQVVVGFCQRYQIHVQEEDIPAPKNKVKDISISSTPFHFGTVTIGGVQEVIDQWDVVSTIGDGSCLLHSILYLASPTYRKCSEEVKMQIAVSIRTDLLPLFAEHLTHQEQMEVSNPSVWLSDVVGEKIADYFHFGVIYLRCSQLHGVPVPSITCTVHKGYPYLLICNTGGHVNRVDSGTHYSAVMRNGLFISHPSIGKDIEPKISQLLEQQVANVAMGKNSFLQPLGGFGPLMKRTYQKRKASSRKRKGSSRKRKGSSRKRKASSGRKKSHRNKSYRKKSKKNNRKNKK